MKKILPACFLTCLIAISCSKSDDEVLAPIPVSYMNMKAGSVWNYELIDNTSPGPATLFTLTSTNRDSTILGSPYHVFINSNGNTTEYFNVTDQEYRVYRSLPSMVGGTTKLMFYLDTDLSAGATWSQNFNIVFNTIPQTLTRTNMILEKGTNRLVNGITYNNVICVYSTLAMPSLPPALLTSSIKSYYAPNYGLIEDSTRLTSTTPFGVTETNTTTKLKTAVLL